MTTSERLNRMASYRGPEEVLTRLRAGSCVLLCGRFSDGEGREGARQAVLDALSAAKFLDSVGDFGATALLRDQERLWQLLWSQTKVISEDKNGRPFANRYLLLDHRAIHGIVIALSAGSGRKLTADRVQPAVKFHADLVDRFQPALTVATNVSRIGRGSWLMAPFAMALIEGESHHVV